MSSSFEFAHMFAEPFCQKFIAVRPQRRISAFNRMYSKRRANKSTAMPAGTDGASLRSRVAADGACAQCTASTPPYSLILWPRRYSEIAESPESAAAHMRPRPLIKAGSLALTLYGRRQLQLAGSGVAAQAFAGGSCTDREEARRLASRALRHLPFSGAISPGGSPPFHLRPSI